jgi:hypothetical protein
MSDERILSLEKDVRVQLHQVTREVSVERTITRDLIEALHKRLDGIEANTQAILAEVRTIKAQTGNGHA